MGLSQTGQFSSALTSSIFTKQKMVAVTLFALALTGITPINTATAARSNTQLTVDAVTVTNPSRQVPVGTAATSTFSISFAADSAATNLADLTVSLSIPANSQVTLSDANGSNGAADGKVVTNASKAAELTATTISDAIGTDDLITVESAGIILAAANTVAGTLQIKPDVPGIYVVTLTGSDFGSPSTANNVTATFTVVAEIEFENTSPGVVVLGNLGSRSKSGQLTKSGSTAPYTMTGTDARSGLTYQYQTDGNYGVNHSFCTNCPAQLYESDERAASSAGSITYSSSLNATTPVSIGTARTGAISLTSGGNIRTIPVGGSSTNTTAAGTPSFGSHFGPQFWSKPFSGSSGQAVSYEWGAAGSSDDYEIYAFLVKITVGQNEICPTATDYGTEASHSILSYGRGKTAAWTQATGSITETGCYRFRFVGGTYDASGGFAVGSTFYIDNVIIGLAQVINFVQPSDAVTSSSNQSVVLDVTSNAPDPATANITLTSLTTSNCTVNSATKTVTILANRTGLCTVRADSAAIGAYGPASSVTKSFTILSQATKPVSTGGDLVTGTQQVCSTLTVQEGSWTDGGSAITATAYQWRRDGVDIAGATNNTYLVTSADAGSAISFSVTKTNSVGSTTANSNSLIISDATLSNLTLSSGTLSPSFASCTTSYAASVAAPTISVTPTVSAAAATVTVALAGVVSGEPTNPITLSAGANTVTVTVTNGSQSRSTTITVTYAQAPTVVMLAPTNLTGTGGTINASVNANGLSTTDIKFELDTLSDFSTKVVINGTPNTATGTSDTSVSASSGTLTSETRYYLRALATNSAGTTTTPTFTFVTPAAPAATTNAASNLTATGATLNGAVIANGDQSGTDTTVKFEYSLNADMTNATEVNPASDAIIAKGTTSSTAVSVALTGLTTGQTYYFRTKATNNYGTNFGSTLSFTLVAAPTVTTAAPTGSNLTFTTAKLRGTINANSDDTTSISFKWGTATNPTTVLAVVPTTVTGNLDRVVEANLTGLTQNTTYYFFLTATNSIGTANSTEYTFTTPADPAPTAVLSAPTSNSLTSPFTVTVTFSEVVTGFISSDLTISGATTGWTAQTAQNVANAGRIYTVEYRPGNNVVAGTFTVALAQGKVVDSANQANTAATSISITIANLARPNISYATNSLVAGINSAIAAVTPSNSGGAPTSWSIDNPLPAGMSFNTTTGEITGTPTELVTSTTYTITATNAGGSNTTTFVLEVLAPPTISYQVARINATTNSAITATTPTNTGSPATSWSISGSLPAGLTFDTATGVISGTPTAAATSSTFTITATNAVGSRTTTIEIEVTAPAPSGGGGGGQPQPQPPVVVPNQPIITPGGTLPSKTPGATGGSLGGRPVEITLTTTQNETIALRSDETEVEVATDAQQIAPKLVDNTTLNVQVGTRIELTGAGYDPNVKIYVWLFSTPTQIAIFETDSNGDFIGEALIPANQPIGSHTLQIVGAKQREVLEMSVGLLLAPAPPVFANAVYFKNNIKLDKWEQRRVTKYRKAIQPGANFTCIGYVSTAKPTAAQRKLASKRAKALCAAATFDLSPQLVITKVRPLATAPLAKKAGNKRKTGRADLVYENPRRTQ